MVILLLPHVYFGFFVFMSNQCADVVAKLGAKFSAMNVSFVIPPVVVVNLLALDREATSCNRLISVVG